MALTKREERRIFYKLKKADGRQKLRFKSALGSFRAADRIFEQIEEQFELKCPRCYEADNLIKYGRTEQGTQRHKCKECEKTFTANRHLPFYKSQYSRDHWKAFCTSMLGGSTLPELAEAYDLNVKTAFFWRHKLLSALRELEQETWLAGRVWADKAYMHANLPGKVGGEEGHITLLTGKDYKGKTFLKPVSPGRGISRTKDLEAAFDGVLVEESSTLVTDGSRNFSQFAREHGVGHEVHDSKSEKMDLINWLHSHFKRWMKRFNGVGADYMKNYCTWFAFMQNNPDLKPMTAEA